ncbi:MAG: DNA polymerase III subunit delta [Treponema sp.]|nr:DNA polymerase III subunit delta [Treponema sp.]
MPTSNAHIFLGPEIGKKQDAIDDVRNRLSKNGAPEEFVFYASETPALKIAEAVQNHSLFAQPRLFIVKNADQIKKKEELSIVASCMEELESDTVMILVSDELKLAAGIDNCCPGTNRKIFYEMFENQKTEWVQSFFRREGRKISPDGVDLILEMVENNTDALKRECSRLMLFLPNDRPIEADDIEKWLSHNREESAFTLFSRIATGDTPKAIESLHTLLAAKESPIAILAALASCFRKLRNYHTLFREGKADNSFELKKIGLSHPKAKSDYTAAARRYTAAAVDACLAITAEYDVLTRSSGSALESVLMDRYVLKVMGTRG